mmetsp:Transcript_50936/g.75539  ORF Transcript_50936/g.75539 Transcript_50936/m.75539 type:complete len:293 (+) Transcript_50936:200-1078(+)|eukprot:CAMPEP_0195516856 /NCGR_PEP_ID=MMETSP0794_2-20130614/8870_1 /TAXON_ID=515487 /ORGANISM="Stephanopyxis turris, Strain CCMP 815" /LENGTH=292 /DNA_ID=CAMNT_0040645557 /DNA_START=198 /DNA_END=1076 /DNA_ORIENTATION=-
MSFCRLPPTTLRVLMREIANLAKSPPAGIRFVPRDDDIVNEVYAELEGPEETPFVGGRFLVKLVIDSSYPSSPPRGFFLTKIFHPNVSTAGEICVNALKKDWKPNMGLAHVLKVIWCLLLVPFPESSLNDDAGRLFMESYEEYSKKAAMMTRIYAIEQKAAQTPSSSAASSCSSGDSVLNVSAPCNTSSASSSPHSLKSKSPNRPASPKKRRGVNGPKPIEPVNKKSCRDTPQKNIPRTAGSASASTPPAKVLENSSAGDRNKRKSKIGRVMKDLSKSHAKKNHRRKRLQRL